MKVRVFDKDKGWYVINCPACGEHLIAVSTPFQNGAKWTFNGSFEKPTFQPSINIFVHPDPESGYPGIRCHFHVEDGLIKYCGDSTHSFSGKTVDLLDVDTP